MTFPIVKLRPKADARAIRFGAPWIYSDQLVLDRRTRNIPAGSFVQVNDDFGNALGIAAFNAGSKITCRMMDLNENAVLDRGWIKTKISTALAMRGSLYPTPHYRLIHAEGDFLPGLVIDRFGDTAVMQPNAAWADANAQVIADVLVELGMTNVVLNASGRARKLEGLDDQSRLLAGVMPAAIPVPMNGAIYMADVEGGQKTGLFFDQRSNHAFAGALASNGRVLDVFSHVGGFGLAMLAAGAVHATSVDGSAPALDLAVQGAALMGKIEQFATIKGDAFDQMNAMIETGTQFEVVICDPPAFAPSKPALQAGLRAYERVAMMAAKLVVPGGYLGLCSCSHAATADKFTASSMAGIGRAGRRGQIIHRGAAGPDHPTHPYLAESGYLKSIFLRLD